MAADPIDDILNGIAGLHLEPGDSIRIPINVFDDCKRLMDPDHNALGESTLFNFCVQSNINPTGVVRANRLGDQVNNRYLFRLCIKVWLNDDMTNIGNRFVEGTPSGGNTPRQVQVRANLHDNGFHYIGPVLDADSRPAADYLPVGNRNNVYNFQLKNAIMHFQ